MAPKGKDTEDTIDKLYARRPQIVLRTLPPIVFTSPTNALTFQLTMSVSGIKPSQSVAPQLEGRPSYEREFGIGAHEEYAKPQVVKREFDHVNARVDEVKRDLKTARETLDEKIEGLETRLTAKIDQQRTYIDGKFDQQKTYIDDKFDQQEKTFLQRVSRFQFSIEGEMRAMKDDMGDMKRDITKLQDDMGDMKHDITELKDDMKQIKQMLQHLLPQGGVPPTPLPSSSSQAHLVNPPQVVVHAPSTSVPGPSSPRRRRRSSATRRDAESIDSHGSQREQLTGVFRSIQRQVSRGFGLLNKSRERLDQ